jgi:hypothetical protein
MIVQNVGRHGVANLTFTVPQTETLKAQKALEPVLADIGGGKVTILDNIAKLSVVGVGMKTHSGVAATLFQSLADAGINIELISTSEIKISVVIARPGPTRPPVWRIRRSDSTSCDRRLARPAVFSIPRGAVATLHALHLNTRGQAPALGFSDAVATGLAPDGGLFLPETLPDFSAATQPRFDSSYAALCFEFLRVFATDIPAGRCERSSTELRRFTHPDIAPLVRSTTICSSSNSSTAPPWRSRTLPSSCSAISTSTSADRGRVSMSSARPRATPDPRRFTACWANRAPRFSSSIPKDERPRSRNDRWPARGGQRARARNRGYL